MKKLLTLSLAATALLATSCSDETGTELKAGAESTVTFTTQLPDLGTRAFGEAANVKSLKYAVYESGKQAPLAMFSGATSKTEEMTSLTKNVTLQLTTGKTYDVIFWASADAVDATSKFDETTRVATLAPTVNNNDADDAFYAKATVSVTGNSQQTVELYRPYAQLNIGTDDFDAAAAAGYTVKQTQVSVPAYSKLNLADGSVSEPVNVTHAYADIPASETFPVARGNYKYLSMDYVLVPATKSVVDVTFAYTNGSDAKTRTFTNVPVQRNYRTNIYGSLLTSTTDFNVVIEPNFYDPAYSMEILNSVQLATAVTTPGATIYLKEGETYSLHAESVAEGVTIIGNGATLNIPANGVISADNVTLKNVKITNNNYAIGPEGNGKSVLKITGNNTVLDGVEMNIQKEEYGVTTKAGTTTTIKNSKFKTSYVRFVRALVGEGDYVLENCEFSGYISYAINSSGKVGAKKCTFNGWLSNWKGGGSFEDCTFNYGPDFYPCAVCYGNTTFTNCTFQKIGNPLFKRDTEGNWITYIYNGETYCKEQPSADGDYGFDAYVSGGAAVEITLIGCKYSTGDAVDTNVFVRTMGDGRTEATKVTIDGHEYAGNDPVFARGR